jgi:hypothetical protein
LLGNASGGRVQRTRNTHVLTNATTATFTRQSSGDVVDVSYQIFDLSQDDAEGAGILQLARPIFFPNATQAGAAGDGVFLTTSPVFFDNVPRVRDKIWVNADKPTTTWT